MSRDLVFEKHSCRMIYAEFPPDETLQKIYFTEPTLNDASAINNNSKESSLLESDTVSSGSVPTEQLPVTLQPAFLDADTVISTNESLRKSSKGRKLPHE